MQIFPLPSPWALGLAVVLSHQTSGSRNIDQVVGGAVGSNPSVVAARQRVLEAESHVLEVGGKGRPQLVFSGNLSGSYGEVAQPPSLQTFGTAEGSLTYALPNAARNSALIDQAQAQLEASRAGLNRVQLDVQFRTTQAYINVLRNREALAISEENFAQAQRQVADTQKRIAAGDVPASDLLKVQVPEAQNRAAVSRARNAVRLAEQNLNGLLQHDLGAKLDLMAPPPPPANAYAPEAAIALALRKSPDVAEAEANLKAGEANFRVVRRVNDPDLSLVATHTRTSDITAYSHLTTVSLNISLPLADGGTARQQARQAQLQVDQATTALKLARQQVELTVQQALLEIVDGQSNVTSTAATLAIASQSVDKSRQAYQAGLTSTREVLDAQVVYAQALTDANSATYDLQIAYAHLRQLLGGELP